jgi:uncharacterized protein (DUF952 family)
MHIFHITEEKTWNASKNSPEYKGDSLADDGFIHCCTSGQIEGVLKKWFKGKENLILLKIDIDKLLSPIKYENLEGGVELFPHIYGPINTAAVVSEKDI